MITRRIGNMTVLASDEFAPDAPHRGAIRFLKIAVTVGLLLIILL
jgi:hypothetical protein